MRGLRWIRTHIAAEMEIMELDVEIEYEGANVDQDSDLSELAAEMEVLELEAIKGGSARLSDPDTSSLVNNNEGRPQPGGHTRGLLVVISSFLNPGNNSNCVVLRCKQTRDGCTSLAEKKVSQGPIRQMDTQTPTYTAGDALHSTLAPMNPDLGPLSRSR